MNIFVKLFLWLMLLALLMIIRQLSLNYVSSIHTGVYIEQIPMESIKLEESTVEKETLGYEVKETVKISNSENGKIRIAVVSCGNRKNDTLVLMKSVVALSTEKIVIYIFTEEENMKFFEENAAQWPNDIQDRCELRILPVKYPAVVDFSKWISLFKQCASLRLFLPDILHNVDSVLYVDTDVLFVAPVERLWNVFREMNSSHMSAMVPESEDAATGWYNRFAKHPYAGPLGMNSGVMLMNLTRMREFSFVDYLDPILKEFRQKLVWGDQDIINIIFHYHMDKLYILECTDNYRPDHCMYMNSCRSAADKGINVVHASRSASHKSKFPVFKTIYKAWNEYEIGGSLVHFYSKLRLQLVSLKNRTRCGQSADLFLKYLSSL